MKTLNQGATSGTSVQGKINTFHDLVTLDAIKVSTIVEIKPKSALKAKSIISTPLIEPSTAINSLDISPDNEFVAAATNDNTIVVMALNTFDPRRGSGHAKGGAHMKHVNHVQKYGAANIKWLPTQKMAITSSTKTNDDLRMVSFDVPGRPRYQRYFKGHTCPVGNLDVTRDGRNIISAASIENKVLLWDVNMELPIASLFVSKSSATSVLGGLGDAFGSLSACSDSSGMRYKSWNASYWPPGMRPRTVISPQPVVAFDPMNMIFAVAFNSSDCNDYVKLFDLRNYKKGPFKSVKLGAIDKIVDKYENLIRGPAVQSSGASVDVSKVSNKEEMSTLITALGADYTQIKFSPNGRHLVLNTNGPYFYILDAIDLKVKKIVCRGHRVYNNTFPSSNTPEVTFAMDIKNHNRGKNDQIATGKCSGSGHIIGGNGCTTDPRLYVWDIETGREVGIINKDITSDVGKVEPNFNLAVNYVKCTSNHVRIVTGGGHRITMYKPASASVQGQP